MGSIFRAPLVAAIAVCALLVSSCGDEPEEPALQATVPPPSVSLSGQRTIVSDGGYELLLSIAAEAGPEDAFIAGRVGVAGGDVPRLRLLADGERLAGVESTPLPAGDGPGRVIACVCRVPAGVQSLELEVAGEGEIEITDSSLVLVAGVRAAPVSSADGLPDALLAAVAGEAGRIESAPTTLAETRISTEGEEAQPLLVVGSVRAANSTAALDAVQVDAVIGDEQVQPTGATSRPGNYAAVFAGELGPGPEGVSLVSSTADGSLPVSASSLYVCACVLAEGAISATPE